MRKPWLPALVTLVAAALGVTAAGVMPASAASTTPLRVMPLGDSITWGVGSSTGNGYRGPLWDLLATDGHPLDFVGTLRGGSMSDPDNQGHQGYRIHQIAELADASLTRSRPNVVTLMIGTNDLAGSYQVSTATARLKSLVNQITAAAPDATVLVASLVVSTSGSEEQYRPAYNQAIPQIVSEAQSAGKHVAYVDMSSLMGATESGNARFRSRQQVSTIAAGSTRLLWSDRAPAGRPGGPTADGVACPPTGREHWIH